MLASLQSWNLNFENALNFSVNWKGLNYVSSGVFCGIPFPMELRPLAQLCTELQSCSSLDHDKWVSHSAVILVDSFVIFVILIRALWENDSMVRFFFFFFNISNTVGCNSVSCKDGGFVLRNKHVGGMWWKCTTESYTLP